MTKEELLDKIVSELEILWGGPLLADLRNDPDVLILEHRGAEIRKGDKNDVLLILDLLFRPPGPLFQTSNPRLDPAAAVEEQLKDWLYGWLILRPEVAYAALLDRLNSSEQRLHLIKLCGILNHEECFRWIGIILFKAAEVGQLTQELQIAAEVAQGALISEVTNTWHVEDVLLARQLLSVPL